MHLWAQDQVPEVIRSKDKVLLDGKAYYIHIVQPGQTAYSISKAYHVDWKRIADENPVVIMGLRPEMSLKIPVVAEEESLPSDEGGKYTIHRVQEGETPFSISRQYHVSVQDILDANPGLDIYDIPLGHYLRIPRKEIIQEKSDFSQPGQSYIFHWVNPKETLYSLAKKYNISVDQIREANDGLPEGLKSNTVIRIPVAGAVEPEREVRVTEVSTGLEFIDEELEGRQETCDTIDYYRRPQHLDVALMLPFYLEENSERTLIDSSEMNRKGERIYKVVERPADWIYPRSYNYLEFYEGVMIALDSLVKRGLSVNLHVFDTGRDSTRVMEVITQGQLDRMDLIIGPAFVSNPGNLSLVADFARSKRIPVVSPFSSNTDVLKFNPNIFQVQPSMYTEIQKAAEFLAGHYHKNLVLVHSGDAVNREYIQYLKKNLGYQFSYFTYNENVVLKEVVYNQNLPQRDSINILEQPLVTDRENLVIVFSHDEPFVSKVLSNLNTLTGSYPIQVIGFSNWQRFENIELEYFYNLRIQLVTNYFVDYHNPGVQKFLRQYQDRYKTEPSQFSPAWDGFDISFFFLSAMQKYGRRFEDCLRYHHEELLHTEMKYKRRYFFDGFENEHYFILSFEPGWQMVKKNELSP